MFTLAASLAALLATHGSAGAVLQQPEVVASRDGALRTTLAFGPLFLNTDAVWVWTAGFNGSVPGPTLRVRPGDLLEINLVNAMGPDVPAGPPNTYRMPNSTNLHVHGLHVSPEGHGDNVFALVPPGASRLYSYRLPEDHTAGTFWYHPHLHGSTTLQVGGGGAGVLIVEDLPGSLPEPYAKMPEQIIMLQNLPVPTLKAVANYSRSGSFHVVGHSADFGHLEDVVSTASTNETNVALVNGVFLPTIRLAAGRWQRWRIINGAAFYFVDLTLDGCELQLLQKDGVYLAEIPRPVPRLIIPTGGRADVAVRCLAGKFQLGSGLRPGASGSRNGNLYHNEHIADVHVVDEGLGDEALPVFRPRQPRYLRDLRAAEVQGRWDMNMTPFTPTDHGRPMFLYNGDDGGACKMNDFVPTAEVGTPWLPIHKMQLDTVEEWKVGNLQGHPFHLHVNHFQVVEVDDHEFNYTQPGDWHDTIELIRPSPTVATRSVSDTEQLLGAFVSDTDLRIGRQLVISGTVLDGFTWGGKSLLKLSNVNGVAVTSKTDVATELAKVPRTGNTFDKDVQLKFKPSDGMYGFATVRLLADRFTGQSVLHCHFLNHEDLGCIATTEIVKGTTALGGVDFTQGTIHWRILVAALASVLAALALLLAAVCEGRRKRAAPDQAEARECVSAA